MSVATRIKFKVDSFRRIPNPYLKSENPEERLPEMFEMICDVKNVPINIPMDTNPRKQSLKTDVAKEVIKSLTEHQDHRNFYLLNRGLLLSVKNCTYDNSTGETILTFEDPLVHGNVDGGHTYEIIKAYRDRLDFGEQFVKIEVLTGVEDFFEELAKARNYSVKVKEKSMEELCGHFDIIKEALKKEKYINDISYKENEIKRIDILDIVAIFNMFNIDAYPTNQFNVFPIKAYNGKNSCLETYKECYENNINNPQNNPFYKMSAIMPDILKLYDTIEKNMPKYYKADSTSQKKYGSIVGVTGELGCKKYTARFSGDTIDYISPKGFLYPIVGAFRALVIEENGMYKWKKNPFLILDKTAFNLVANTIQTSREKANNPNATGKTATLWQNLFMTVMMISTAF